MGRAFEYRKARKLKRWGHMARVFTKIGKEIEIAVKSAGPDPSANTRLRILIQNAKAENMPKENIERAIKRATEKDSADYKEVIYEGYGPHGIAVMVETATDNTNRTVANVRMHFSRCGGTLGNSGSVAFLFEHKCVFKFHVPAGTDFEELELSMIDLGVDEFAPEDETTVTVEAPYESFGAIQKWLDDQNYEIVSGESIRIATDTKELHGEEREAVEKLIVCAQAMCLESMLCCDIPEGALYYGEIRRRERVSFTPELRAGVRELLAEMHELYRRGYTPRVKPTRSCNACSLKELCLPKLMKSRAVSAYLRAATEESP